MFSKNLAWMGGAHFMHLLSLSHGPADSCQMTHFPVPDTNNSLRLLRDPMHSVGSASCGEPGPLAPLLNVAAGIPRIRCSQTPCELLLCSPQREGAQAPSAQHRCGSPRAPARPGRALTGPRLFQHSCVGTAICTHGRADLGFSVSHSRADTD